MRWRVVKFIILLFAIYVSTLQVIMERATLEYVNYKYVDWGKAYVTRFGRKSPYYLNIEGKTKYTLNNNLTIHLLFYEYLHNEYRRSFVEMHLKLCDAVNSDPYVGKMLANSGITCPLPPGIQRLMNMTIEAAEFPNVWPIRKAKVEVNLAVTDTTTSIARIMVYINFLQKRRNK